MKPATALPLAAALLCAAGALTLYAAEGGPGKDAAPDRAALAALKASPGDRKLLLRAVETAPDLPSSAPALEASARLLLKKDPEDYAGFLALCKALRCSGRPQEGLPNCKRAMELDPTAYPSYRELGLTYAAAGNPRRTSETLQQGVELSSASCQAYYILANVLEKHGDAVRAHSYYEKGLALAARGGDLDSRYYQALLRAGSKRTAQAARRPAKQQAKPKGAAKATPPATAAAQLPACLEKFKAEFLQDNLGTALEQSEACLKLGPRDPGLAAERAPLLVRLGRYEEGVKEYERAAALYGKDPMSGFCRIKAAETWLKLGDTAKAAAQYRLALAANPKDLNALKGLAAAQEARSDSAGALATYEEILKLDPANARARARREEMKAAALTPEQMLAEMKLRQAVDAAKTALSPDDVKLFKAIKTAEIAGGVDYVKAKAASAQGLIVRKDGPDGAKLMLTGAGYKAYVALATRDAIKLFEGKGIGMRDIFQLRDLAGAPMFDAKGLLTAEGIEAWRKAADGTKTWLLAYEPVPQSPKALQAEADVKQFTGMGYGEISEPEYLWLLRFTDCPDDVMRQPPLAVKTTTDGTRMRYFICWNETALCMNEVNNKLPPSIAAYRNGDSDISDSKTSTAFFGTGAVKKHRLCENGKIWAGP